MAKVKRLIGSIFCLAIFFYISGDISFAAQTNVVTPVFIVRGRDLWRQHGDPKHLDFLLGVMSDNKLPSTWLIQYDALKDPEVVNRIKSLSTEHELGIFLEISQLMAEDTKVAYKWYEGQWSAANRLFTSGYVIDDRKRLVEGVFEKFKEVFGSYPTAVGAWHIDGWTLRFLREKYQITSILGLADQYSTDGYQVWGQYVNQPYYVSLFDPIEPADDQTESDLVKILWAPRQQISAFSREALSSNFSVQVNDYHRMLKLPREHFGALLEELTVAIDLPLAQTVIGIEVAELEEEYWPELQRQVKIIASHPLIQLLTMSEFTALYRQTYPQASPAILYESSTDLVKSWWFMSPQYRLGLRLKDNLVELIDLRFYQTLPVADNDQILPDPRSNLYRIVPALIDEVALNNSQKLGKGPVTITQEKGIWQINFAEGQLRLNPGSPGFINIAPTALEQINPERLAWHQGELRINPPEYKKPSLWCFNQGFFEGAFPCLKAKIVSFLATLPDIRLAYISGRHYLGVRTGKELLSGLAFPPLEVGKLYVPFSSLEYFRTSTRLYPQFEWQGRQEQQLELYGVSNGLPKGGDYGQGQVLKITEIDKRFENSYYLVPR